MTNGTISDECQLGHDIQYLKWHRVIPRQITQGPTWPVSDVSKKITKNTSMCSTLNKLINIDGDAEEVCNFAHIETI